MMQEMTQYLYEFQNGERVRNIGFIKLDNQMDRSGIRIYAKDMDDIKGILFHLLSPPYYSRLILGSTTL